VPPLTDEATYALLQSTLDNVAENFPDQSFTIAVLDAGSNLKAYIKMDGLSPAFTERVSVRKAITSDVLPLPSEDYTFLMPGQGVYSLEFSNGGMTSVPGGWPLFDSEGHYVGSIGISGRDAVNETSVGHSAASNFPNNQPLSGFSYPAVLQSKQHHLNATQAIDMFNAARNALPQPGSIVITDAFGVLRLLFRQDGAPLGMTDMARKKAVVSSAFGLHSEKFQNAANPPNTLYTLPADLGGVFIAGGAPVFNENQELVAAIGVGSSVTDPVNVDRVAADAGARAYES